MNDIVEIQMPDRSGKLDETGVQVFAEGRHPRPEEWWDGLEGGESFREFHDRGTGALLAILTEGGIPDEPARAPRISPPDERTR